MKEFKLGNGYTDPSYLLDIEMKRLSETMDKYIESLEQLNESMSKFNEKLKELNEPLKIEEDGR
jgi:hypothetical protein